MPKLIDEERTWTPAITENRVARYAHGEELHVLKRKVRILSWIVGLGFGLTLLALSNLSRVNDLQNDMDLGLLEQQRRFIDILDQQIKILGQ
jgi:hypothetical protein